MEKQGKDRENPGKTYAVFLPSADSEARAKISVTQEFHNCQCLPKKIVYVYQNTHTDTKKLKD